MTEADLQSILRRVDPRLLVVRSRHLVRLIHRRLDRGEAVPRATDILHRFAHTELLDDDFLAEMVAGQPTGDWHLVLTPTDLHIDALPADRQLRFYWRMLFCEAVDAAVAGERPGPADAEMLAEARAVLETDRRIPEGSPDDAVWRKFLALAATRTAFEPETLPLFYPLARSAEAFRARWDSLIRFDMTLATTKPDGAADAFEKALVVSRRETHAPVVAATIADGNFVRVAIERWNANDRDGARAAIAALVDKLTPIVADATNLGAVLAPLLPAAAGGDWPHAKRLLVDLQTLALDLAGELSHVDLPGSLMSFGRKPVKRPLPHSRPVVTLRQLRSARRHLDFSHLADADEHALADWLESEIEIADRRLRETVGPVIRNAFEANGLIPTNAVERNARDAAVDDLLDPLSERGFLRFADLRDAIAKFDLKLPDLRGFGEWLGGDPLLRIDRRLKNDLDGLYHAAEVYLRWFQRMSSLAFGNRVGRFATLYLILPLLGSYLLLESVQHVAHAVGKAGAWMQKILAPKPKEVVASVEGDPPVDPDIDDFDPFDVQFDVNPKEAVDVFKQAVTGTPAVPHDGVHLVTGPAVVAVAVVLLGIMHWPAFRRQVFAGLRGMWRLVRWIVFDGPKAIWNSPFARHVRNHAVSRWLYRRFSLALAIGLTVAVAMALLGARPKVIAIWAGFAFVWVAAFAWTRLGRAFEDRVAHTLADTWRLISVNLVPGLIGWFVWLFREVTGAIERGLYAVDEYFRFREGADRPGIAGMAILSLLWFPVAYLVRFSFYLLIEPQVNPIKHFPVVTVSHKVLLPTVPWFSEQFNVSSALVLGVVWCIPGVFGFLAWEFLANWRLYRATRPPRLKPLAIGHHGETLRGLLRPGFHSGTLPKQFRKIRAAVRAAERAGTPLDRHRFDHERHHAEAAVRELVERQFVRLVVADPAWGDTPLSVVGVESSVRRIRARLDGGLAIAWHFDGDAIVQTHEWPTLSPAHRAIAERALTGLAAFAAAGDCDRADWHGAWGG
jgi:hypothetical protein